MRRIHKFFKYVIALIAKPKELAEAVNAASSPDELDEYVMRNRKCR